VNYPDYNPQLDSPPLSDAELQALDDLLGQLPSGPQQGDPMNVEMLDGYLTGLLLAPTPAHQVPAAQWMPGIWGGDPATAGMDGAATHAPFSSGKQKKLAVVAVLRHLHAIDIALGQHPERWEPVFSVAESDGRDWADAEDWCIGFLHATALDVEGWGARFDDPHLGPLLLPIGLLGGDESQLPEADRERLADLDHRDALSRQVPDAVMALAAQRG
jgi:uncharacterized protein